MHSVLNSKNGIIYYDEDADRSYSEIIDLSKFTDENIVSTLESSINYGEEKRHLAAKITLKENDDIEDIKQIVYNEEWYDRLHALASIKVKGPGGAKEIAKQFFVIIKDGDSLSKGTLEISVVIPNS